jgi:hypothetical protein
VEVVLVGVVVSCESLIHGALCNANQQDLTPTIIH